MNMQNDCIFMKPDHPPHKQSAADLLSDMYWPCIMLVLGHVADYLIASVLTSCADGRLLQCRHTGLYLSSGHFAMDNCCRDSWGLLGAALLHRWQAPGLSRWYGSRNGIHLPMPSAM